MESTKLRVDGRHSRRRGFTLIELTLVVAIAGALLSFTFPVYHRWIESARRDATLEEMEGLVLACIRYYDDTATMPAEWKSLRINEPFRGGWDGPYQGTDPNLRTNQENDAFRDAWGSFYLFELAGSRTAVIRSAGGDREFGQDEEPSEDDLVLEFNVNDVARLHTVRELAEINQAIGRYNQVFTTFSGPLPHGISELLDELHTKGLLSRPRTEYDTDGWERPYVPGPVPVHFVTSQGAP